MKKTKRPTFFSATPVEREIAAVKACGHLHIPPTTLLKFTVGNTVQEIKRQCVDCAGFRLSNAFPDNVVEMTSGEIVYVEKYVMHEKSQTLFFIGRQFLLVSKKSFPYQFHHVFKLNISTAISVDNSSSSLIIILLNSILKCEELFTSPLGVKSSDVGMKNVKRIELGSPKRFSSLGMLAKGQLIPNPDMVLMQKKSLGPSNPGVPRHQRRIQRLILSQRN